MDRAARLAKMLEADPEDAFALYALAQERAKAGEHEDAVGLYERCLRADDAQHYAAYHMALSLEALGRREDAAAALERQLGPATSGGDDKAAGEIAALLDQLAPGRGAGG